MIWPFLVTLGRAKIFIINDENVFLVNGEVTNVKITYPYDLRVANSILKEK